MVTRAGGVRQCFVMSSSRPGPAATASGRALDGRAAWAPLPGLAGFVWDLVHSLGAAQIAALIEQDRPWLSRGLADEPLAVQDCRDVQLGLHPCQLVGEFLVFFRIGSSSASATLRPGRSAGFPYAHDSLTERARPSFL